MQSPRVSREGDVLRKWAFPPITSTIELAEWCLIPMYVVIIGAKFVEAGKFSLMPMRVLAPHICTHLNVFPFKYTKVRG